MFILRHVNYCITRVFAMIALAIHAAALLVLQNSVHQVTARLLQAELNAAPVAVM